MVDKTEYLKEGDRFRFQQITIEARKFVDKGLVAGTGSHRARRFVIHRGKLHVNRTWRTK